MELGAFAPVPNRKSPIANRKSPSHPPSVSESWSFLVSGALDPALNMAWDEALLENAEPWGRPLFRTYAWTLPAATFGYFQRFHEVASLTPLRPLLRRPTGGGLVPHDADWTYSVVIPPRHPWWAMRAPESYQRIHEWLRAAFRACGLVTELAPAADPAGPGQCFVGAERNDLLARGRKIAGAAQRRNRLGLLIQGSIQPPGLGPDREAWERALRDVRAEWNWQLEPEMNGVAERAAALAEKKYRRDEYHCHR